MPTVTGSWVPNSTTNQRMRLVIEYTSTTTASTVSGSGSVYVEAGYSFNDSDNTFTASGTLISAFSGAKSINVASNGRQKVHDFTFSHARGSSAASKSMAFSLTGINYVGSSQKASVSASVSIPAKPAPAKPGSVVVTRISLTRVRITWTGGVAQWIQVARRSEPGSNTAAWLGYETLGSGDRASGVEYDVATGYEWAARVSRIDGGVYSDWGYYSTGPARLFDAPPAPTGVSTTYQADNRRTTTWSLSDSASHRATAVEWAKWLQSTGKYSGSTVLAASSRSHIDTANHPNDRIRSRVRAVNAAGGSAWVEASSYVSTTPKAPTGVAASRSGADDVVVALTNQALSPVAKIDVQGQSSTDGVTWSSWANITGHTGITSGNVGAVITRTITTLDPAKRWRFRAVAWVQEPTYLSATSATSNAILLLQAPAAPKTTAPVSTQSADTKLTFRWSHQALDGSGQTAAEVRYRLDGGSWVTLTVNGAGSSVTSSATVPAGSLEWQARTKGSHASYGPWSGVVSVLVAERPTIAITAPVSGATFASNRLKLTAVYGDGSGTSSTRYRRILRDAVGTVLEDVTVSRTIADGASVAVTYTTVLADGVTYVAELTVTSGTGLTSVATQVTIPVAFLLPGLPMLVGQWDPETATVALQVANALEGVGIAETAANRIERSIDGGLSWEPVADMVPVDGTTADPLPPFRPGLLYRAVAVSALGAETLSDPVEVDTTHGEVWIVGEDGTTLVLALALSIDPEWGHERVSEQYLGDRYPTAHYGQARPVTVQVSAAQLDGHGIDSEPWLLLGQDVYYRDPEGRAMWASITSGPSLPQTMRGVRQISLTLEAVEHGA